jgi:hypothetical protein
MDPTSRSLGPPGAGHRHVGHAHFWERALSRGQFLRTAAGVGGAALSSGLWMPSLAQAAKPVPAAPNPIPGTTVFIPGTPAFHVNAPGPGVEVATITDFNGIVGVAHVTGTGMGMDASGMSALTFDADMRFQQGLYRGVDGHNYQATFGFI